MCSLCSFELRVNKICILLRGNASVFLLIINECYPRINAVALRLFFFYGLYCKQNVRKLHVENRVNFHFVLTQVFVSSSFIAVATVIEEL